MTIPILSSIIHRFQKNLSFFFQNSIIFKGQQTQTNQTTKEENAIIISDSHNMEAFRRFEEEMINDDQEEDEEEQEVVVQEQVEKEEGPPAETYDREQVCGHWWIRMYQKHPTKDKLKMYKVYWPYYKTYFIHKTSEELDRISIVRWSDKETSLYKRLQDVYRVSSIGFPTRPREIFSPYPSKRNTFIKEFHKHHPYIKMNSDDVHVAPRKTVRYTTEELRCLRPPPVVEQQPVAQPTVTQQNVVQTPPVVVQPPPAVEQHLPTVVQPPAVEQPPPVVVQHVALEKDLSALREKCYAEQNKLKFLQKERSSSEKTLQQLRKEEEQCQRTERARIREEQRREEAKFRSRLKKEEDAFQEELRKRREEELKREELKKRSQQHATTTEESPRKKSRTTTESSSTCSEDHFIRFAVKCQKAGAASGTIGDLWQSFQNADQ